MRVATGVFLGMLSGTSRDGADVVLVRFADDRPEILSSLCVPYPADLAEVLRRMIERQQRPEQAELEAADRKLADFFALSAWGVLNQFGVEATEVTAIGSHGQTVWHNPTKPQPETIQLGNPQRIADLLRIPTVGDFRQADVRAGGQGAPLAPLLHRAFLKPQMGVRAVLNIGGIANISVLNEHGAVSGFDTGPGNCLLDSWIRRHQNADFDDEGQWAAGGKIDEGLLNLLLADPYFHMRTPKSTGVEYFNFFWLQDRLGQRRQESMSASFPDASFRDIQATLSELTARTAADAVKAAGADELLVCGGGTYNLDLLQRLRRELPGVPVETTAVRGLDPDWLEGILFAWLARERLGERPQETMNITGARHPVLLGDIFYPS